MSKPQDDRQGPLIVHEITGDALNDLVVLLASEGLPIEDVAEPERRFFVFLNGGGETVGYGGLEQADGDMLLRSVVTTPKQRGAGHGRVITQWFVAEAERSGAGDLYLLTTTACDFFAKLGFEMVERAHPFLRQS